MLKVPILDSERLLMLATYLPAAVKLSIAALFPDRQDVGTLLHPGAVVYNETNHTYPISGSGENMWFGIDDFHFAWKKVSGDVALTVTIAFSGTGGNPHRKAVLMIRQSL